jgi:hypothetical protein
METKDLSLKELKKINRPSIKKIVDKVENEKNEISKASYDKAWDRWGNGWRGNK